MTQTRLTSFRQLDEFKRQAKPTHAFDTHVSTTGAFAFNSRCVAYIVDILHDVTDSDVVLTVSRHGIRFQVAWQSNVVVISFCIPVQGTGIFTNFLQPVKLAVDFKPFDFTLKVATLRKALGSTNASPNVYVCFDFREDHLAGAPKLHVSKSNNTSTVIISPLTSETEPIDFPEVVESSNRADAALQLSSLQVRVHPKHANMPIDSSAYSVHEGSKPPLHVLLEVVNGQARLGFSTEGSASKWQQYFDAVVSDSKHSEEQPRDLTFVTKVSQMILKALAVLRPEFSVDFLFYKDLEHNDTVLGIHCNRGKEFPVEDPYGYFLFLFAAAVGN